MFLLQHYCLSCLFCTVAKQTLQNLAENFSQPFHWIFQRLFCIIWTSLMFMSPINLVLKHHIITECAAVMAGTASLVQSCQRWRCWTVRWETTMLVSGMLGDTIIVCSLLYNIQYVYVEQHYFVYTFIRIYLYIIYIYNGGRRTKRKPK